METTNQIRILQVNFVNDPFGGVPVFLINVFRYIDHEKIHFDFLTSDVSSYVPYIDEIKKADGKAYEFHINVEHSLIGKLRFGKALHTFLKTYSYDIIHINCAGVSIDCISAIAAKYKNRKVIVHSHSAGGTVSKWKLPIFYIMKLLMQKIADACCACSLAAAKHTFTNTKINNNDIHIIRNGIDFQKFRYDPKVRLKYRNELNLEDHLVVGHVGRFVAVKNHEFLIDIFVEILKKEPSAILLLVGQGELRPSIQKKVNELCIENSVVFCGTRNDIENIYQVMDIFLFPSLYEGVPISLIEAQANGLPCLISNNITAEIDLTPLIHRASLTNSPSVWAETALSIVSANNRGDSYEQNIISAGYSIKDTALQLSQIYEQLVKQ